MYKRILSFLFIIVSTCVLAQQNFTLYNMMAIPQRTYANPALLPKSRLNIGLPLISSNYLALTNSGFQISDIFKVQNGVASFNIPSVIDNLSANNYLTYNVQVDLLSFGIKRGKNYFGFNITEKADVWFRYPKDFFEFAWYGNAPSLGTEKNLNFGANASHYREWGLNYAREISEKFTIGGRLKILAGMENIWTEKADLKIYTDPTDFSLRAQSDVIINTNADESIYKDFNVSNFLFNFKNLGLAADLGASYKLNDKFHFSASAIDIGFINWSSNPKNFISKNPNKEFVYGGVGLSVFGTDTVSFDKAFKQFQDSLANSFDISDKNKNSYRTWLPSQFHLAGNYIISDYHNVGLILHGQVLDGTIRPGATISYSTRVGNVITSSLSYSIFNNSYNNIGFGLTINILPVQIYLVSDNVLGALQFNSYKTTSGSTVFLPAYAKNLNLRFGINLTMGRKNVDKDGDGIDDKKDECPTEPGLKELKGCPDKDGDKVIDKLDACPDVAGIAALSGCPDADGDGIKDMDDACPADKGPAYTKGCPDMDNDSIKDAEDECPEMAGLKTLKGCPDKDNDGVIDKTDKCPDKAGPASNDGCPEARLIIRDADGNIIGVIVKNKDGQFVYEMLLPDNATFTLENEDGVGQLNLVLKGSNRKLVKGADGKYHFEILEADTASLQQTAEDSLRLAKLKFKEVVLKTEEKALVKTAFKALEFEAGKEVIKESSYASLTELSGLLKKHSNWKLKISGHTDNSGSTQKNLALSKERAEAVKRFMILTGISANNLIIEFYGSAKPIADNKTPAGRQKNRRVEMVIVQ